MGEGPLNSERWEATPVFWHVVALLLILILALWLRRVPLQPDPALQGYVQIVTGLLAFVFSAVTLVRFQGTQDRISLILGAGFLLSGAVLPVPVFCSSRFRLNTNCNSLGAVGTVGRTAYSRAPVGRGAGGGALSAPFAAPQ